MADVSIVIPTYNTGPFLRQTLESALAQDVPGGVEVLVVDDGSTDGTAAAARAIGGVHVIEQANAGDSAARNAGFAATDAPYVLFLDHDDVLRPDAARRHVGEMADGIDMTVGSNDLIDSSGAVIRQNPQRRRRVSGRDVAMGFTPSFSQCLYRRAAIERIGGFRPAAGPAADHDLNLRLLGTREAGLCHGEPVMSYRLHGGQQTKSPSRLYAAQMAILEEHLGPGGAMEDAELLGRARRHWAAYYGQFLPQEIVRAAMRGEASRAWRAAASYVGNAPGTMYGTARFWRRRLSRR